MNKAKSLSSLLTVMLQSAKVLPSEIRVASAVSTSPLWLGFIKSMLTCTATALLSPKLVTSANAQSARLKIMPPWVKPWMFVCSLAIVIVIFAYPSLTSRTLMPKSSLKESRFSIGFRLWRFFDKVIVCLAHMRCKVIVCFVEQGGESFGKENYYDDEK